MVFTRFLTFDAILNAILTLAVISTGYLAHTRVPTVVFAVILAVAIDNTIVLTLTIALVILLAIAIAIAI